MYFPCPTRNRAKCVFGLWPWVSAAPTHIFSTASFPPPLPGVGPRNCRHRRCRGSGCEGFSGRRLCHGPTEYLLRVCRYCRTGREHLCPHLWAYGVHMDGGFAEAMVVYGASCLPPALRLGGCAWAAWRSRLACCIHGMDWLALQSGATVLVIGAGLIGLMLTRLARLAGAGLIVASEPQCPAPGERLGPLAPIGLWTRTSEGERQALERRYGGLGLTPSSTPWAPPLPFEQAVSPGRARRHGPRLRRGPDAGDGQRPAL